MTHNAANGTVFLVHRWDGAPESDWYPWVKRELELGGYDVYVPAMPDSASPKIEAWLDALRAFVRTPDEHTYFIGHSVGCQAIWRFLEGLAPSLKIGGAVFVAGWLTLTNLATDEEIAVAQPWLTTPIQFGDIARHLPRSVAIFSDDDPYVPLDTQTIMREKLGADIVIENGKGHFTADEGIVELQSVVDAMHTIIKKKA